MAPSLTTRGGAKLEGWITYLSTEEERARRRYQFRSIQIETQLLLCCKSLKLVNAGGKTTRQHPESPSFAGLVCVFTVRNRKSLFVFFLIYEIIVTVPTRLQLQQLQITASDSRTAPKTPVQSVCVSEILIAAVISWAVIKTAQVVD